MLTIIVGTVYRGKHIKTQKGTGFKLAQSVGHFIVFLKFSLGFKNTVDSRIKMERFLMKKLGALVCFLTWLAMAINDHLARQPLTLDWHFVQWKSLSKAPRLCCQESFGVCHSLLAAILGIYVGFPGGEQ
eukprot:5301207-Amphidinium_carterae.1